MRSLFIALGVATMVFACQPDEPPGGEPDCEGGQCDETECMQRSETCAGDVKVRCSDFGAEPDKVDCSSVGLSCIEWRTDKKEDLAKCGIPADLADLPSCLGPGPGDAACDSACSCNSADPRGCEMDCGEDVCTASYDAILPVALGCGYEQTCELSFDNTGGGCAVCEEGSRCSISNIGTGDAHFQCAQGSECVIDVDTSGFTLVDCKDAKSCEVTSRFEVEVICPTEGRCNVTASDRCWVACGSDCTVSDGCRPPPA